MTKNEPPTDNEGSDGTERGSHNEEEQSEAEDVEETSTSSTPPNPINLRDSGGGLRAIYFEDIMGRKYSFPFNVAKTWKGLSRLIIESCTGLDQIALIKKNLAPYELMTDNNEIVVSSSWAAIASPGISVKMSSNSSRLINIHFKDALGRKYVIPYKVASTWQGMEEFIRRAFQQVVALGPQINEGWYDLIGPNDQIILPSVWDSTIQPGQHIRQQIWPMDRFPPPPPPPGRRTARHGPVPPKFSGSRNVHKPQDMPIPPRDGIVPPVPSQHIKQTQTAKTSDKTAALPGIMGFFSGKPKKKTKNAQSKPDLNLSWRAPEMKASRPIQEQTRSKKSNMRRGSNISINTGASSRSSINNDDNDDDDDNSSNSNGSTESSDSSDSDSSNSATSSNRTIRIINKRALETGLVVICRGIIALGMPIRRPMAAKSESSASSKLWRLHISGAQVYQEDLTTGSPATIELIRRPLENSLATSTSTNYGNLTWIHLSSTQMNWTEFEDTAQSMVPLEVPCRRLVIKLFHVMLSKRQRRSEKVIPGTIIRCDSDTKEEIEHSVIFASIPNLYNISEDGETLDENVPVRSFRHRGKAMKKQAAARGTNFGHFPSMIVPQVWMLITNSCIFTYGNIGQDSLKSHIMSIVEDTPSNTSQDRGIRVMDEERRLFYIPAANRKSFFEIKRFILDQLIKAVPSQDLEQGDASLVLRLPSGEAITEENWANIRPQPTIQLILVSIVSNRGKKEETDQDQPKQEISSLNKLVLRPLQSYDIQKKQSKTTKGYLPSSLIDNEGFVFLGSNAQNKREHQTITIPHLNKMVPEFFGWIAKAGPKNKSNSAASIDQAYHQGIHRLELKLLRPVNANNRGNETLTPIDKTETCIDQLYTACGETNIYKQTKEATYEGVGNWKRLWLNTIREEIRIDIDTYFQVALLTLESFVPLGFEHVLLGKYFGALQTTVEEASDGLNYNFQDFIDQGSRVKSDDAIGWVISQFWSQIDKPTGQIDVDDAGCDACSVGTVYATAELAVHHIQQYHDEGIQDSGNWVRRRIQPLEIAIKEWEAHQQYIVIKKAGTAMLSILRKLVAIQDGVSYNDELRQKRGLPRELIDAFSGIVAYICAIPMIFGLISKAHSGNIYDKRNLTILNMPELKKQHNALSQLISDVTENIRKAERILIMSATGLGSGEDIPESFQVMVGPHYIAAQFVFNLLDMPVNDGKQLMTLQEDSLRNIKSTILKYPNKQQILAITSLASELNSIREFYELQRETVQSLMTVLNPKSYSIQTIKKATGSSKEFVKNRKMLYALENKLLSQQKTRLSEDLDRIEQMLLQGSQMIQEVRYMVEIIADEKSLAIFIFTTVTVTFLPLSFVASYVSMNGGTIGLGWTEIQYYFWQIAAPLTIAIAIFCVGIAKLTWLSDASKVLWWWLGSLYSQVLLWKDEQHMSWLQKRQHRKDEDDTTTEQV